MIKRSAPTFFVILALLLAINPAFASGATEYTNSSSKTNVTAASPDRISTDMESLKTLYRYIDTLYYENIDNDAVMEKMAQAMLDALGDKYSFYTPPSKANDYKETLEGKYGGIGVYLTKPSPSNNDMNDPSSYMVTIVSCFASSPAMRSGLHSGDLISAIEGEKVDNMTSTEVSDKLRGDAGTEVNVTIYRNGQSFDISIKREIINTPTVSSTMLENSIGYIMISSYTQATSTQLLSAVKGLMDKGMKSLIIDERNNHGGDVDICLQCANIFLKTGDVIVSLEGRKGTNTNQRYLSTGSQQVGDEIPIVILTNEGSASSAEIFAAALHDNKRATLIGSKTFGKGIVQTIFPFGKGYVQITTGHYYTPAGVSIHGTGIEPDIAVADLELKDDQISAYEQLMKEKTISRFVDEHKEFTPMNLQLFADTEKDSGIDQQILKILVRNEYYARMNYADVPIADAQFDPPLKRAIEFLQSGK